MLMTQRVSEADLSLQEGSRERALLAQQLQEASLGTQKLEQASTALREVEENAVQLMSQLDEVTAERAELTRQLGVRDAELAVAQQQVRYKCWIHCFCRH